jgi:hypothetical protein
VNAESGSTPARTRCGGSAREGMTGGPLPSATGSDARGGKTKRAALGRNGSWAGALGWAARARGLHRIGSRNEGAAADLAILGSTKHGLGLGKGKGS